MLALLLAVLCLQMDRQSTKIDGLRGQLRWERIVAQIERGEVWQRAMDFCREASE